MKKVTSLGAGLLLLSALSACGVSPVPRTTANGLPVIATAADTGIDRKPVLRWPPNAKRTDPWSKAKDRV